MNKPKKTISNGKRYSKRYITVTEIVALSLFLIGLAFIIVGGILKDNGYGDFWWPAVGLIGFFSCCLIALFLVLRVMKDALSYEIDVKSKKYDAMSLFTMDNLPSENVMEKLIAHKFKETDCGYLRKKVFSFSKDAICYYAKCVNSTELKKTIEFELGSMDALNEKSSNICFILFVYKNGINKSDIIELRETSKAFIISETVMPTRSCHTSIIVLIDSKTNEGSFLDMNSKTSISVYAHGCKLVKKYFADL